MLNPELAQDRGYVSRFLHEAKIVNDVRHPNIVDIYDFIESPARVCCVMELLEGPTLKDAIAQVELTTVASLNLTVQLVGALSAVHSAGVVHRDLKPQNIIVTAPLQSEMWDVPSLKILDFGIAKANEGTVSHRTTTGSIMGTPAYMAPEQVAGAKVSSATDLYALAEILYEMLARRPLFDGDNLQILGRKMNPEPPDMELPPNIPGSDRISALIRACVSPNPKDRPAIPDFLAATKSLLDELSDLESSATSLSVSKRDVMEQLDAINGYDDDARTVLDLSQDKLRAFAREATPADTKPSVQAYREGTTDPQARAASQTDPHELDPELVESQDTDAQALDLKERPTFDQQLPDIPAMNTQMFLDRIQEDIAEAKEPDPTPAPMRPDPMPELQLQVTPKGRRPGPSAPNFAKNQPAKNHPAANQAARPRPRPAPQNAPKVVLGQRAPSGPRRWPWAVLVLALLGAAGAWALRHRIEDATLDQPNNPLAAQIEEWRQQAGELRSDHAGYQSAAQKLFLEGTNEALLSAQTAARRALLSAPEDPESLTQYVVIRSLLGAAGGEERAQLGAVGDFIRRKHGAAAAAVASAQAALTRQEPKRCLELLHKPQTAWGLSVRAECALQTSPQDALTSANTLKTRFGGGRAHLLVARALAAQGRYRRAHRELEGAGGANSWLLPKAQLLLQSGRAPAALRLLKRAMSANDQPAQAALLYARAACDAQKHELARTALERFALRPNASAAQLYALSRALLPKDPMRALELAERAAKRAPSDSQASLQLVYSALTAKAPQRAAQEAERGSRLVQGEAQANFLAALGVAELSREQPLEAAKAFERAISAAPTRARLRLYLAITQLGLNQKSAAQKTLKAQQQLDLAAQWDEPDRLATPMRERALALAAAGQHPLEARVSASYLASQVGTKGRKRLIASLGTTRAERLAKAYLYLAAKDEKRAQRALSKLEPQSPWEALLLARTQRGRGRRSSALKSYERALSLNPKLSVAQVERAALLADRGQKTAMIELLLQMHKKHRNLPALRKLLYDLGA